MSETDPALTLGAKPAELPLSKFEAVWAIFLGTLLLFAVCIIVADVILRALFAISPLYSFEITNYVFGAFCSWSFALSMIHNPHVRIDFVVDRFPHPAKAVFGILAALSLVYVAFFFAKASWEVTFRSFALGAISNSSLGISMVLPQALWSIGNSLFFLLSLKLLYSAASALRRP
ncbi:MAG: TRAP transporter small permease subunit [Reyranellaceae bacterium]